MGRFFGHDIEILKLCFPVRIRLGYFNPILYFLHVECEALWVICCCDWITVVYNVWIVFQSGPCVHIIVQC